jgi:hypothetical protein
LDTVRQHPWRGGYRFKIIGGELYKMGAFTNINGGPCHGIAKRTGGAWEPVGCLTESTYVNDMVEWNGTLYITGRIRIGGASNPKDIAYLENGNWVVLGSGIVGGFGIGRALEVYNDELYISGSIPIGPNAGHGIMRWDGQQYQPVGTGFQGSDGAYTYLVGASELQAHDGLLWASGSFSFAGYVPAPGVAFWNGEQWCAPPLGPRPKAETFAFFHDTLYVSCNIFLDSVDVNCAVRYIGTTWSDTCSLAEPTGLEEQADHGPRMGVYRRADGILEITDCPVGVNRISVFDTAGRELYNSTVVSDGTSPVQVPMPPLYAGICLLRVGDVGTLRFLGP